MLGADPPSTPQRFVWKSGDDTDRDEEELLQPHKGSSGSLHGAGAGTVDVPSTPQRFVWKGRPSFSTLRAYSLQPHKGSSGRASRSDGRWTAATFNPTKVRLEGEATRHERREPNAFNPTKVRLEAGGVLPRGNLKLPSTPQRFVWKEDRSVVSLRGVAPSTPQRFVWKSCVTTTRRRSPTLQPHKGSSGSLERRALGNRLGVPSTPQRFVWKRWRSPRRLPACGTFNPTKVRLEAVRRGIPRNPLEPSTPQRFVWKKAERSVIAGNLLPSTPQRFVWKRLTVREVGDGSALQPHKGSSGSPPRALETSLSISFNPTKVRLEVGDLLAMFRDERPSTPQRFVWKATSRNSRMASGVLQPHKGSSGSRWREEWGVPLRPLQPHKGSSGRRGR